MIGVRRNPYERLLELGGGANPYVHPQCMGGRDVHIDIRMVNNAAGQQCVDIVADLNKPLPITSDEFDACISIFCLEHVSYRNVPLLLSEVWRVIKPGGRVVFVTPNTEQQMRWIAEHPEGWDGHTAFDSMSCVLFGDQDYAENSHRAYFSPEIVSSLFQQAGFEGIITQPFGERGTDLCVEAKKPGVHEVSVPPVRKPASVLWAAYSSMTEQERITAGRIVNEFKEKHWSRPFEYAWILENGDFKETDVVLDAGGGQSYLSMLMAHRCKMVVNADSDIESLNKLQELYGHLPECEKVKPWRVDLRHLPDAEKDHLYDKVVCCSVLEHCNNPSAVLKELWRVLKPGGKLLVTLDVASYRRWNHVVDDRVAADLLSMFGLSVPPWPVDIAKATVAEIEPSEKEPKEVELRVLAFQVVKSTDSAVPSSVSEPVVAKTPAANISAIMSTTQGRASVFDRHYFCGGAKFGGYLYAGMMDFPCHEVTVEYIMARRPTSVLELGSARGYIIKRLQDRGVVAYGMEISRHCYLTRVCDNIVNADVCISPWSVPVKIDLCISVAVLEHIPEQHLPIVIAEMARTCKRGLHGIDFGELDDGNDKSHVSLKSKAEWEKLFAKYAPGWPVEIVNKEALEEGSISESVFRGDGKVKIACGTGRTMFHHGWINIDGADLTQYAASYRYNFLRRDLREGLPYATGSVDLVYLPHLLHCLTYEEGLRFLRECRRVLRPRSGVMRIVVPDSVQLVDQYLQDSMEVWDEVNEVVANAASQAGKLSALLGQGAQAFYDIQTLHDILSASGFMAVMRGFRDSDAKQILQETLEQGFDFSVFVDAVPMTTHSMGGGCGL